MKNAPLTLNFGSVRLPLSADGFLHAPTVQTQLGLGSSWAAVLVEHGLPEIYRDFGVGVEAALSVPDFAALVFALATPEARRWQRRARDLLARAMQGDVRLAAQIAERSPEPAARRWLSARLESTDARRELLATVARHGGRGGVYGQLGSISNRAVLGKDSASVREERGVRATRDGLSSTELLRLAYIDTVTNHAIQERGTRGNAAILRLHEEVTRSERRNWDTLPGQVG
ncbi:DNA damage response protein DdrC [Deinococcus sp. VB343]|uniref:DNA damage response protein DdrC n=1 Tax=Deinococcus sp. VB142 TaxID=3112952 RepID=A0AAU6PZ17_9DEIO